MAKILHQEKCLRSSERSKEKFHVSYRQRCQPSKRAHFIPFSLALFRLSSVGKLCHRHAVFPRLSRFQNPHRVPARCWYGTQVYVYLLVAFPLEGHDDLHMFSSCEIPCALHFNFHPRAFPSSFFAVCQCVLYCYLTVSS
jgi:hypothetical protein